MSLHKNYDRRKSKHHSDLDLIRKSSKNGISDMFSITAKPIGYLRGDKGNIPDIIDEHYILKYGIEQKIIKVDNNRISEETPEESTKISKKSASQSKVCDIALSI